MHREMISPVEQMRAKYKKRRKEAGTREDSTMAKLAAFTSTIRTTKKRAKKEDKVEEKVGTTAVCTAVAAHRTRKIVQILCIFVVTAVALMAKSRTCVLFCKNGGIFYSR